MCGCVISNLRCKLNFVSIEGFPSDIILCVCVRIAEKLL